MLTSDRLRELIEYDAATGLFRWLNPQRRAKRGWFNGTEHGSGYLVIFVDGTYYRAHRLAWLYMKGRWPRYTIDHRNRQRDDNRFENLRDVSIRLNSQNREGNGGIERREGKSGTRWRVAIGHFGRKVNVGTFLTEEEARAALLEARQLMHPGFLSQSGPQEKRRLS